MSRRIAAALALSVGSVVLSGCVVVGGSDSDSGSSGFGLLLFLVPIVLIFGVFRLMRPKGRRAVRQFADEQSATAPSPNMLRAELSVLADDVLRFEPRVTLKPEARDDFEAALHRYRVAQAAIDDTEAPVDLVRVQRVVDEASWSMSRAKAILDDRPPPPPPAPLQHQGPRGEPAVMVDPANQPQYVGSPATFQTGWFAFGPGMFGGLLLGSMLGDSDWFGDEQEGDYGGDFGDGVN